MLFVSEMVFLRATDIICINKYALKCKYDKDTACLNILYNIINLVSTR